MFYSILKAPEPDDPLDGDVTEQYKKDYEMYKRTANYWTIFHTRRPTDSVKRALNRFFPEFEGKFVEIFHMIITNLLLLSTDKIKQVMTRTRRNHANSLRLLSLHFWDVDRAIASTKKKK